MKNKFELTFEEFAKRDPESAAIMTRVRMENLKHTRPIEYQDWAGIANILVDNKYISSNTSLDKECDKLNIPHLASIWKESYYSTGIYQDKNHSFIWLASKNTFIPKPGERYTYKTERSWYSRIFE